MRRQNVYHNKYHNTRQKNTDFYNEGGMGYMNPNDGGMRYIMLTAGEMGYVNPNERGMGYMNPNEGEMGIWTQMMVEWGI